ncbi:hypothetical protein Goari_002932, partial [Gossypium aridum]|nr:hypothetical protein [Gossypium aridum]
GLFNICFAIAETESWNTGFGYSFFIQQWQPLCSFIAVSPSLLYYSSMLMYNFCGFFFHFFPVQTFPFQNFHVFNVNSIPWNGMEA